MEIFRHHEIAQLAATVRQGGIVIYPTDTIWGLGCNGLDEKSTRRLKNMKGKPENANLIWLLPSLASVEKYCGKINPQARYYLKQKHTTVIINGQAVRVIRSGWLNKFLTACGVPVVGTSANLHGEPVIQSWRQAVQLFHGQTDAVVRGRKIYHNTPSSLLAIDENGHLTKLR